MLEIVDGTLFAGLIPNAMIGLSNQYPELKKFYRKKLNPKLANKFLKTKSCFFDALIKWILKRFFGGKKSFFPQGISILNEEPMNSILQQNNIVDQAKNYLPKIPIFIYHGSLDKVVPIKDSLKTFNIWCKMGLKSGEFMEDSTTGHSVLTLLGLAVARPWIVNRMNGEPPVEGCVHNKQLSTLTYPEAIPSFIKNSVDILLGMMKFKLGPMKRKKNDDYELNSFIQFMDSKSGSNSSSAIF
ncbi:uncharacterized protein KGF55_005082 [Candida pseudojiufengensis]|uniref:uncharacterized protein n=1 Tax=Candida pseudojiufengensis TaxID=497109 RepID=UPI002225754E|nr:uncharacterized protein KGF55_005082 [Candida pseudojiufengensis]KAI5959850.1 hypothetical protein KGF55_005082 [Candida pseudojiufengensis]